MAEAERSRAEAAGVSPGRRREELEALLKRVATHIVEAGKELGADHGKTPVGGDGGEKLFGSAAGEAPSPEQRTGVTEVGTTARGPAEAASGPCGDGESPIVAPPAAPIRSERSASRPRSSEGAAAADAARPAATPQDITDPVRDGLTPRDTDLPPGSSAPAARRIPATVEPPILRSLVRGVPPAATQPDDAKAPDQKDATARAPGKPLSQHTNSPRQSDAPSAGALRDESWDKEGLEQLARTFDVDPSLAPLRGMLDVMAASPGRGAAAARDPEHREMQRGPARAIRDPAEARLADAARRIEAALGTLAPRETVDQLGQRFTRLEGEVSRAVGQLQRLDGIEAQLGVLGTRLTDEQIVALFEPLVPTHEDLTRFAEEAAGRAADRVLAAHTHQLSAEQRSKPGADAASGHQIKALSELLATFMDERRSRDVGTQEALETLQLAMQHVLDKFEPPAAVPAAAPSAPAPLLEPDKRGQPEPPESQYVAPERMPGEIRAPGAVGHDTDHHRMPEARFRGAIAGAHSDDPAFGEIEPTLQAHVPEPPAAQAVAGGPSYPRRTSIQAELPRQPRSEPFPPPPSPYADSYRAMLASARKASEKAKPASGGQAGAKPAKLSLEAAFANVMRGGKAGKAVAGIRPGVLIVASLAAFLLAGYWLLSGSRGGISGAAVPTAIERTETPAGQPSSGEMPAPRTEGEPGAVKPAPSEPASPVPPKRTSDPPSGVPTGGDMQEASLDAAPARFAGPGMAVVLGLQPTVERVMAVREQAHMASLSQRTGAMAAHDYPVTPEVSPVATAAIAAGPAPAAPATSAAPAAPPPSGRQLTLPPAATGPLSLRLAAAQGDASAQLEVATRLAEGRGVKQSFAEAAQWYERAAAQGEGVAQYRLATLYEGGMGVRADRERAKALYRQAAEQGNVKAMHNLAVMSVGGAGGAPDYATAAALFGKAASHGLADSQYNLGVLYESGLGVPKDHAAAYRWYALAARSGDSEAARRRDLLIARLPAETIEAANAQIAGWQPAPAIERANDARVAGEAWKQRSAEVRQ